VSDHKHPPRAAALEMEFLSHLSSTSPSANPLRPTLFELIAQDQLRDLIQPALRYIVAVFPIIVPSSLTRAVLCSEASPVPVEVCDMVRRVPCRIDAPHRSAFSGDEW